MARGVSRRSRWLGSGFTTRPTIACTGSTCGMLRTCGADSRREVCSSFLFNSRSFFSYFLVSLASARRMALAARSSTRVSMLSAEASIPASMSRPGASKVPGVSASVPRSCSSSSASEPTSEVRAFAAFQDSSAARCASASSSSSVRLAAPHSHGSGFFPFDGPSPQDSARELIKVRRFSMRSCSTADNRYSAFLTDLSCSPVSIGSVALAELVSPFLRRSWLLFRCTVIQGRSSPSDSLLSLFGVGIIPTWYI